MRNSTTRQPNRKKATTKEPTTNGISNSVTAPPPGFHTPKSDASFSLKEWERIMKERMLFLLSNLEGSNVEIHTKDNNHYVGIFYAYKSLPGGDMEIYLKNAKAKNEKGRGETMIFLKKDVVQLSVASISLDRKNNDMDGIMTDTEITGKNASNIYGRALETANSWLSGPTKNMSLNDGTWKGNGTWDQFETNKKLFGVRSTYDEEIYTTKLDKTKISFEQSMEAERLAREIEGSNTSNVHLAEERGQKTSQDDLDEESRYSSVIRNEKSLNPESVLPSKKDNLKNDTISPITAWTSAKVSKQVISGISMETTEIEKKKEVKPTKKKMELSKESKEKKLMQEDKKENKTTSTTNTSNKKEKKENPKVKKVEDKTNIEKKIEEKEESKKKLNPNAKEFKLSASAATFTPSFSFPIPTQAPIENMMEYPAMVQNPYMFPPPLQYGGYQQGDEWTGYDQYSYPMDDPNMQIYGQYAMNQIPNGIMQQGINMNMGYPPLPQEMMNVMGNGSLAQGNYIPNGFIPQPGYDQIQALSAPFYPEGNQPPSGGPRLGKKKNRSENAQSNVQQPPLPK